MTKDEALRMAIEALIHHTEQTRPIEDTNKAIQACKEALAEIQEPVAWMWYDKPNDESVYSEDNSPKPSDAIPLYTTPPSREWVGLSDEEIDAIFPLGDDVDVLDVARGIEAKLREKNELFGNSG